MKRNKIGIPWQLLVLIVLVLVSAMAVPIFARYIKQTDEVVNTFSHVDGSQPEISEVFDGETKKDVTVKVPDDGYPVYVRAAIIITWKNEDGIVYFKNPVENKDYKLTLRTGPDDDWEAWEDGYYYYKKAVPSNGQTSILLELCELLEGIEAPEGYSLSVEIIAQTVQAIGSTDVSGQPTVSGEPAYKDAWETSWAPQEEPADEPGAEEVEP